MNDAARNRFDFDATKLVNFGFGHFVISHGKHGGKQAIFIEPVSRAGEPGADASDANLPKDDFVDGSVVITFANVESVAAFKEQFEAAVEPLGALPKLPPAKII